MNIREIIKGFKKNKITQQIIANSLGISKQNMANKMKRGTFSISELNKIGELDGMNLAFVPKEITYDEIILITPIEVEEEKTL